MTPEEFRRAVAAEILAAGKLAKKRSSSRRRNSRAPDLYPNLVVVHFEERGFP